MEEKNVRMIRSADALMALAAKANTAGDNCNGLVFELERDIDMKGVCW